MMRHLGSWMGGAAASLLLVGVAGAQGYTADFEPPAYALGPLEGQGIWTDWAGNNGPFTQVVNTQNHTSGGSQAIEISSGADTVADFDALPGGSFDSGQWTLSMFSLVPVGSVGVVHFLGMNQWDVSGAPGYEWNLWLGLNASSGQAELHTPDGIKVRPLVFGAWTEIRAEYDLDANSVLVFYDGVLMHTYDPRCGTTGGCSAPYSGSFIDALDLYPDPPTNPSPIFFDDLRVEPTGGAAGTPICFGDGSGAACGCANEAPGGSGSGCLNSLGLGGAMTSTGTASTSSADLTLECANIRSIGLFFQAVNTIGGGTGVTFGDGIRCCGGSVLRVSIESAGAGPATVATTITTNSLTAGGTGLPLTTGLNPGDKRCYQYWYRDPGAGNPCGGQLFNLSNAVTVTWGP